MTYAIILAGGTGTRLGGDIPKQYIEVNGKPIIAYCLKTFQDNKNIDKILIVASAEWKAYISEWCERSGITKIIGVADGGSSRQHSILKGLEYAKAHGCQENDVVILHDAARPNVTDAIIDGCINGLEDADGVMPVITIKDTVYYSKSGNEIEQLLNRDELFAGQAPESFRFGKYYEVNSTLTEQELAQVRGSSEVAFRSGLKVKMISGTERNYKITTAVDLEKFITECDGEL